jgi:MFS family permease
LHRTWTLIVGRLLQGASGGAMLICQVAVLSHQFNEGPERARAFSAWGIVPNPRSCPK